MKYNLTYKIPFWESGHYTKSVFIELDIKDQLRGDEQFYVNIDHVYVKDRLGYSLIKRNATSKRDYIPLNV